VPDKKTNDMQFKMLKEIINMLKIAKSDIAKRPFKKKEKTFMPVVDMLIKVLCKGTNREHVGSPMKVVKIETNKEGYIVSVEAVSIELKCTFTLDNKYFCFKQWNKK
jgi:hypothetical protein